ncbi:MAG: NUDIX domain-containing protein [Candidatus Moraniibacteriota bacterium]
MNNPKPVTTSVALVIYNEDRSKFLIVKRPKDDSDMAGHWGFPAASKKDIAEEWEDTIKRAAKNKLGVDVEIVEMLGEDTIDRGKYVLVLRDYEARIIAGEPVVPQAVEGVTQYVEQKWTDDVTDLKKSAKEGSLCSRVFLRANNINW